MMRLSYNGRALLRDLMETAEPDAEGRYRTRGVDLCDETLRRIVGCSRAQWRGGLAELADAGVILRGADGALRLVGWAPSAEPPAVAAAPVADDAALPGETPDERRRRKDRERQARCRAAQGASARDMSRSGGVTERDSDVTCHGVERDMSRSEAVTGRDSGVTGRDGSRALDNPSHLSLIIDDDVDKPAGVTARDAGVTRHGAERDTAPAADWSNLPEPERRRMAGRVCATVRQMWGREMDGGHTKWLPHAMALLARGYTADEIEERARAGLDATRAAGDPAPATLLYVVRMFEAEERRQASASRHLATVEVDHGRSRPPRAGGGAGAASGVAAGVAARRAGAAAAAARFPSPTGG